MENKKFITTESVILKYFKTGEINRLFTFLSIDLGTESATAFGAEKLKSSFCSVIQPFVFCKLVLKKNKDNYYSLTDVLDVETNDFLKNDLSSLYLSYFFSDVVLNSYISKEDYKSFYFLIKYSIQILKDKKDVKKAYLFFIIKYLFLSGYKFNLTECKHCSKKAGEYFFNFGDGGIFCTDHKSNYSHPLTLKACELIDVFFENKFTYLLEYQFDDEGFNDIYRVLQEILNNIFGKKLITISSLNTVFT